MVYLKLDVRIAKDESLPGKVLLKLRVLEQKCRTTYFFPPLNQWHFVSSTGFMIYSKGFPVINDASIGVRGSYATRDKDDVTFGPISMPLALAKRQDILKAVAEYNKAMETWVKTGGKLL